MTFGESSINIGNLIRIRIESERDWNTLDGFVRKILPKKKNQEVLSPSDHEVILQGHPMKMRVKKIERDL